MDSIMSIDSPDVDACLASYVPLSNLPTPPMSQAPTTSLYECYHGSMASLFEAYTQQTPSRHQDVAELLVSTLPSNLSIYHPCVSTVASYVERADPSDSVLGLAVCVVESLTNRFVRSWRRSSFSASVPHDKAEVVVVAALAVASAFLEDVWREGRWWSESVAWGALSAKQINVATRCVLADIDYDLHTYTPEMIADALGELRHDHKREPSTAHGDMACSGTPDADFDKASRRDSGYEGTAIWSHGLLTPEPSPTEEPVRFLRLL